MVGSYGSRSYEFHVRASEQSLVAAGAGTYYHTVGISHSFGRYFFRREIAYGSIGVEQSAHKRHFAFDYQFHITVWHTNMKI